MDFKFVLSKDTILLMFYLNYLISPKITNDYRVRYVSKDSNSQSEQTKEIHIKPKKTKKNPLTRKQNRNISRNSRKFVGHFATNGFAILKGIMNCYF